MEAFFCQKITCFLIEHYHTMKYLLHNISTERLHFRPVEKDDFDAWLDLFDSKATATFLGFDPDLSKHELCQTWFDKVFNRYENGLGGMNVLIDKASNLMLGGMWAFNPDGRRRRTHGNRLFNTTPVPQ